MKENDYMKWMEGIHEEYLVEAASWTGNERRHIRMMRRYAAGMGGVAAALAVVIGGIAYTNRKMPNIANGGIPEGQNFLGGKGALHCYVEGNPNETANYTANRIWLRDDENWYNVSDGILHPNGSITALIPDGWEADPVWKNNPYYAYAADGAAILTDGEKPYLVQENKISKISDRAELTDFYTVNVELGGRAIDGKYIHVNAMRALQGGWYWVNYSVDSSVETKDGQALVEWIAESFDLFFNPETGAENRLTAQQNANSALTYLQPASDSSYYYLSDSGIAEAAFDGSSDQTICELKVKPDQVLCIHDQMYDYLTVNADSIGAEHGSYTFTGEQPFRPVDLPHAADVKAISIGEGIYVSYTEIIEDEHYACPTLLAPMAGAPFGFPVYGDDFTFPQHSDSGFVLADDDTLLVRLPAEGLKHEQFAEVHIKACDVAFFGKGYLRMENDLSEDEQIKENMNALGGQGEIRMLAGLGLVEDDLCYYNLNGWNSGYINRARKSAIDPQTHIGQWEIIPMPCENGFFTVADGTVYTVSGSDIMRAEAGGETAFYHTTLENSTDAYPRDMQKFGDWYLISSTDDKFHQTVLYNSKTESSDTVFTAENLDLTDPLYDRNLVGIREAKTDTVYSDKLWISYRKNAVDDTVTLLRVDLSTFPAEGSVTAALELPENDFPQWWFVQEDSIHYISNSYDDQQNGFPVFRVNSENGNPEQLMLLHGDNNIFAMQTIGEGFCVVRDKTGTGSISTISYYAGYGVDTADVEGFAELDTYGGPIFGKNTVVWVGSDEATCFIADVTDGIFSNSRMPIITRLNPPAAMSSEFVQNGTGTSTASTKKDSSNTTTTTTASTAKENTVSGDNFFGGHGELRGLNGIPDNTYCTILEDDSYFYFMNERVKISKEKLLAGSTVIDFNEPLGDAVLRAKATDAEPICTRKNCDHGGSDPDCPFYRFFSPGQYTGKMLAADDLGRLYLFNNNTIYRVASDGTQTLLLTIDRDSNGEALSPYYHIYWNFLRVDDETLLISYSALHPNTPPEGPDTVWVNETILLKNNGQVTYVNDPDHVLTGTIRINRYTDSTETIYCLDYSNSLHLIDKNTGALTDFHVNVNTKFPYWMDRNGIFHYCYNNDARALNTRTGEDSLDYFGGEVDQSGAGAAAAYGALPINEYQLSEHGIIYTTESGLNMISYMLHDGLSLINSNTNTWLLYGSDDLQIFNISELDNTTRYYFRQNINGTFYFGYFERDL